MQLIFPFVFLSFLFFLNLASLKGNEWLNYVNKKKKHLLTDQTGNNKACCHGKSGNNAKTIWQYRSPQSTVLNGTYVITNLRRFWMLKKPDLSFIHTGQFFLGKFIPANILLNPNYANLEASFPDCFFSKWKKTEISAYFRFNLILIFIFSAVLKENSN